ncbi:MAG: M23 family metallopeptidase [Actinomycetota bacterium]
MKKVFTVLGLLTLTLLVLAGSGCVTKKEVSPPPLPGQNLTPIIGEAVVEPQPVKLSDGKYYLMYELKVTNATPSDYSIEKLTLEDPLNKNKVVAEYGVDDIKDHFRLPKTDSPTNILKARETGLITFCLILDKNSVPKAIDHVLRIKTGNPVNILPAETTERIARTKVDATAPVVIGPPLKGDNWFAGNVSNNYGHRNAVFPLNGDWLIPERWAVDYLKLDNENRICEGDVNNLNNWPGYNQDLLAVSDGKVLKVVDEFDDLKIGETLADLNLSNAGGNFVVIDIGGGYSAFYAHLIKGTATVKEGDKVKRGRVIGKLGNSGNSTGPHLHFHIIKGTDPIASQGVPYVVNKFNVTKQSATAELPEAFFTGAPLEMTTNFTGAHTNEMPADNTVVNFKKEEKKEKAAD